MKRFKKLSLFLPIFLGAILIIVSYSCESETEDQCESDEICEGDFAFCSSDEDHYYLYETKKYYCDEPFETIKGSCSDAMTDLYKDMCPTTASAETKATLLLKSERMMNAILGAVSF